MKNYQIINIVFVLNEISQQPMSGALAFKLLKILNQCKSIATPIIEALDRCQDDEEQMKEVEQIEQEVDLDEIYLSELSNLTLTLEQMKMLEPIIKEDY